MSQDYYDALETRDRDSRDKALFEGLGEQISDAVSKAPGWANHLDGFDTASISSWAALAGLPVLRKSALKSLQEAEPPFGGFATGGFGVLGHVFMSPGPMFEPEGKSDDWWGVARSLFAAGARKGDLVHNAFSYHMTPAGRMFETGALALGCGVFPAGVGQTDLQVEAISHLKPRGYCGTPDFLKVLLDRGDELDADLSSLQFGLVSGAALPQSLRDELERRGVRVVQCYGTADLGIVAYESAAQEGMIVNEGYIVEIVRPGTGDQVEAGEVGEIVVTRLNRDYPMIRFATGDLSAVLGGISPCGRTNMRIKGWMGRADQTTKIRGMFVHPEQVADLAGKFDQVNKLRFIVSREGERDVLTVKAESLDDSADFAGKLSNSLQMICKVRGDIVFVPPGSLPNDGIVIADERPLD